MKYIFKIIYYFINIPFYIKNNKCEIVFANKKYLKLSNKIENEEIEYFNKNFGIFDNKNINLKIETFFIENKFLKKYKYFGKIIKNKFNNILIFKLKKIKIKDDEYFYVIIEEYNKIFKVLNELKHLEKEFFLSIKVNYDSIWVLNSKFEFEFCNRNIIQKLNVNLNDILFKNHSNLLTLECAKNFEKYIEENINNKNYFNLNFIFECNNDNNIIYLDFIGEIEVDKNQKLKKIKGIVKDITEFYLINNQLQTQNKILNILLENSLKIMDSNIFDDLYFNLFEQINSILKTLKSVKIFEYKNDIFNIICNWENNKINKNDSLSSIENKIILNLLNTLKYNKNFHNNSDNFKECINKNQKLKKLFIKKNIQSFLIIPLFNNDVFYGFAWIEVFDENKLWNEIEQKNIESIVSNIINIINLKQKIQIICNKNTDLNKSLEIVTNLIKMRTKSIEESNKVHLKDKK